MLNLLSQDSSFSFLKTRHKDVAQQNASAGVHGCAWLAQVFRVKICPAKDFLGGLAATSFSAPLKNSLGCCFSTGLSCNSSLIYSVCCRNWLKFLALILFISLTMLRVQALVPDCLGSNPGSATSNDVVVGKLLSLSEPLFSHLYNGIIAAPAS